MSPVVIHRVRVALVSFGLTVAVSLALGMIYESVSAAREARRFPQVGRSYDIGGRKLNLFCSGEGSPSVIFESGLGGPGYDWFEVQPQVAKFTRACWYDRAGYGWSDPAPGVRDSKAIATDLHALLKAAGIPPPYVLAGHSMGGYHVRVFHGMYPNEVSGMILVDASHEDQADRVPSSLKRRWDQQRENAKWIPPAMNIGLVRLYREFKGFMVSSPALPDGPRPLLEYLVLQPKFIRASTAELTAMATSASEVKASGSLGDIPLIVLTAGKPFPNDDNGFSRVWAEELQPSLARLSSRGKRIMVPGSSHAMPYEAPGAIVEAVREVVEAARAPQH
jgi:pimeloyl-ACP methyl ester carboxylesterase